jgi:carboxymethylenebutenolidase
MYEALLAETVAITGWNGESINAYFARPLGSGPYPGLVLVHHMPGWDEWYKETTLRFARHGYAAISPNLYLRFGHATPEDVAAKARSSGGVPDDQAVGDLAGAGRFLLAMPVSNGRVGIFGTCSGGRHAVLAASRTDVFSAVADLWGGRVVMKAEELTANQPVAPLDYTGALSAPLLGLFGEEDHNPTPEQVALHEEALKKHGKQYEFHMYPGAGHGFFYHHRPAYRQEQAVDGWNKVFAFFEKHLR